MRLNVFKCVPEAKIPCFQTLGAACFDLSLCLHGPVKGFDSMNLPVVRMPNAGGLVIYPGDRLMLPTGLRFQVPEGFELRLSARSGCSLRTGLMMVNGIGVVDSDFVDEVMMLMVNVSDVSYVLTSGDRIAQGRVCCLTAAEICESLEPPTSSVVHKGFGSTG